MSNLGFELDLTLKKTENILIFNLRFKGVMKEFGLNAQQDQKLLIKLEIDFTPFKNIQTQSRFIDSFNEKFLILVNTLPTIFAQKIIALFFRSYQKGRDFYDLIWFLAQKNLEPNYALLKERGIVIKNQAGLKVALKNKIAELDLKQASKDVERFLFYPEQARWILDFEKYLEGFLR